MHENEVSKDILELHRIFEYHCLKTKIKVNDVLSFLMVTYINTMMLYENEYGEEFFDQTCDRMKITYRETKYRNTHGDPKE